MVIVIYVISALFIVLAIALMFGFRRTQHAGLFLMSIIYGASAALALWKAHWWPLAAGFALVWAMRLLGMEPPIPKIPTNEGANSDENNKT